MRFGDQSCQVSGTLEGDEVRATVDGQGRAAVVLADGGGFAVFTESATTRFEVATPDLGVEEDHDDGTGFKAPMNGTVVEILVEAGTRVAAGDTIIVMEAMKMEHAIKAPADGTVTDIYFAVGDLVDGGVDLVGFEAEESSA